MRVFKFGGASIADAGRMAALLPIINEEKEPVLLVLSAMGKTTNALEKIVNQACKEDKDGAMVLVKELEQQHTDYAKQLLNEEQYAKATTALKAHFAELELAVKKRRLPATQGFFFGGDADQHYYQQDLEFIRQARAELFMGLKVFYNSSW